MSVVNRMPTMKKELLPFPSFHLVPEVVQGAFIILGTTQALLYERISAAGLDAESTLFCATQASVSVFIGIMQRKLLITTASTTTAN